MQERQDCTCGGSNENCCHCGGRGFVSSGRNSRGSSTNGVSPMPRRKTPWPRAWPQQKLSEMSETVAPLPSDKPPQVETTSPRPKSSQCLPQAERKESLPGISTIRGHIVSNGFIACRSCNLAFHEKLIDEHLLECPLRHIARGPVLPRSVAPQKRKIESNLVHGKTSNPSKDLVPRKKVALSVGCELCSMCKFPVKVTNLARHQAEKCPRRPNKVTQPTQSRSRFGGKCVVIPPSVRSVRNSGAQPKRKKGTGQSSISREASIEAMPQQQTIDRMDATRGMGFFARENGRFGSHPIHDGFDDESGPDN